MTDPSDPTGADPAPFILHHYEFSPFSEKVRVAFGIKQIAWRACPQPMMMPKDDLLALTGGYRRIPVLQIGSDLYFDSAFILEEIDRRADGPSLYGGIGAGVGAGLSAWCDSWAEGSFFRCVVGLLFGGDFDPPSGFADDRAALLGAPFDAAAMAAARPQLEFQLRGHLALLEAQLSDGRAYLMGDAPDMTDASFIYLIRMMRNGKGQTATLLEAFPRLLSWEKRLDAVGHGGRAEISPNEAIAEAARAEPCGSARPEPISRAPGEPEIGDAARLHYFDANTPPLDGILVHAGLRSVSLRFETPKAGVMTAHLPRSAGRITPRPVS